MKIVTYNLRCAWDRDGINSFIHRAGMIYDRMLKEKPDIVAFQEATPKHLDVLEKLMPEYTFIGHAREADLSCEGLYTAFRKDEFFLSASEVFWMAPNKYKPGSKFEGGDLPRICVKTLLYQKNSGKMFRIYNVHLEHTNEEIRCRGIKIVLDQIAEDYAKLPVGTALLGDFNAEPHEATIASCNSFTSPRLTDVTSKLDATYHEYGKLVPPLKIDYVFLTDELSSVVTDTTVWNEEHCGIYYSDHYPVMVTLSE